MSTSIHRATFIVASSLLILVGASGCGSAQVTAPQATAALEQDLMARESHKWDLFFGTTAQRDSALAMLSPDYVSIGDGVGGITRTGKPEAVAGLAMFPQMPAGTFTVTRMQALAPMPGTIILSYRVSGPGPTGAPWAAYATSVWVYRDGAWTTVFYQASPGAA